MPFEFANASFELGDFSGWSPTGSTTIVTSSFGLTPTDGTYAAVVSNGTGSVSQASIESWAGVGSGVLDCSPDSPSGGSGIKVSIDLVEGDILKFDFRLLHETALYFYTPNDKLFVVLKRSSDGALLGTTPYRSILDGANIWSSSGTSWSWQTQLQTYQRTIGSGEDGTYTVAIMVLDAYQGTYSETDDTGLWIDNLRVDTAPATQYSTPSTHTETDSVPSPSWSGTYTLSVSVHSDSDSAPTPSFNSTYTYSASVLTEGADGLGVISWSGSVTLSPSVVSDSESIPSSTLNSTYTLSLTTLSDSDSVTAPSWSGSITISPAPAADDDEIEAPSWGNSIVLSVSATSDSDDVLSPAWSASISLSADVFADTDSVPTPSFSSTYVLSVGVLTDDDEVEDPSIPYGQQIIPDTLEDSDLLIDPSIAYGQTVYLSLYWDTEGFPFPDVNVTITISADVITESSEQVAGKEGTGITMALTPGLIDTTPSYFTENDLFPAGELGNVGNLKFSQCRDMVGATWTTEVSVASGADQLSAGGCWIGHSYGVLYGISSAIHFKITLNPDDWGGATDVTVGGITGKVWGLACDDSYVLCGLVDDTPIVSRDQGATWSIGSSLGLSGTVRNIVAIGHLFVIMEPDGSDVRHWVSLDGGSTWL